VYTKADSIGLSELTQPQLPDNGIPDLIFQRLTRIAFLCLMVFFFIPTYCQAGLANTADVYVRAEKGDCNAQSYVAHLYATGKGVKQDFSQARYWYQRVANHTGADAKIVAHANLLLGLMYTTGKGGDLNYSLAMECFQVAAKQGYFDAHISIGNLYANGFGVPKDLQRALYWWELADAEGHPKAAHLVQLLKKEMNLRTSG
jgi:TPR repeat protein